MADDHEPRYAVVVNIEEQYSIWPAASRPPQGWRPVGVTSTKAQCLAYIDEVWTDRRPAGLLATELATHGVGGGHVVAVGFGRSVDMVVAMLGIIRAGSAYLCLD